MITKQNKNLGKCLIMNENSNVIVHVGKGSIADELGIEPGDILLSINGETVHDIIDYKYMISDEYIEIEIRKQNNEEWVFEIEKEYDEDLGIDFKNPIIDRARSCANKCIFCFIDQLPRGMRKTLYFKDDDSRLSFLQGNFITLTNMTEDDIDRIIRYRISPLNISVHTTNPALREEMLGNKKAGNILERLERLTGGGIDINCQIVLCRGINDGKELEKTVKDMFKFYPRVHNIAVVPVGLTRFRQGLYPLIPFDKVSSGETISLIETLQLEFENETGSVFVRAADEFYIMAGRELPPPEHYGAYEQLEDGVGMMTLFLDNVQKDMDKVTVMGLKRTVSVVTGMSPYHYINEICGKIENKFTGLNINVYPVMNNYFGEKITVTGLLTGKDIIEQLTGRELGSTLLIPSNMLKSGEKILLDDTTVDDLESKLGVKVEICNFDGSDFIQKLLSEEENL
jgi:Fe-S oxidoreductase, related to NifB/MoaA family